MLQHISFTSYTLSCWFKNVQKLQRRGIEPRAHAWKARMLPLHHRCWKMNELKAYMILKSVCQRSQLRSTKTRILLICPIFIFGEVNQETAKSSITAHSTLATVLQVAPSILRTISFSASSQFMPNLHFYKLM
jgi:hypothetical protein